MGGYGGFLLLTKIVSTQCNKITYLFRKKWGIWTNYFHKCILLNFSLFFHLSYKITIILIISKTFFRREFLYLASCCYFMVAIFLIWKQRGKRIFFSSLHHLFFSGPCLFILFWSLYFTLQTILSYLVMLDFSSYFWNHSCKAPWKLWVCGSQTWGDLLSVSVDLFSWKSKKKEEESACNAEEASSIPGSGRSPGGGYGYLFRYTCLENSMDREAWWTTAHGIAKSQTRLCD